LERRGRTAESAPAIGILSGVVVEGAGD
jgi:hypothetical protein